MSEPTLEPIRQAAERIRPLALLTPVLRCDDLDEVAQGEVWLKAENFQRTGSFKLRGATNAVASLDEATRQCGVLTYSSGNHGAALSCAARHFGCRATVVMPQNAPEAKKANVRRYDGEVVEYDPETQSREEIGRALAGERGCALVPPYDMAEIVCGQGTVGLELTEQCPPLDVVLVCLGGGGLLSGTAIAIKSIWPEAKVIGVEPAAADDGYRSFKSGQLQTVHNPQTIADGARTPCLGNLTFPLIQKWADDIVTVTDEELIDATRFLWERAKLLSEPTGALATAAILARKVETKGKRVAAIVSGGNCDVVSIANLF